MSQLPRSVYVYISLLALTIAMALFVLMNSNENLANYKANLLEWLK